MTSSDFQTIKTYVDLQPYAGLMVAIKGDDFFRQSSTAFSCYGNTIAHISSQTTGLFYGGRGYHLDLLFKSHASGRNWKTVIVNGTTLENRNLSVRKVTAEELKLIIKVLASSSAAFSDLFYLYNSETPNNEIKDILARL